VNGDRGCKTFAGIITVVHKFPLLVLTLEDDLSETHPIFNIYTARSYPETHRKNLLEENVGGES